MQFVWVGLASGDHNECAKYDPVRDEWTRVLAPREQTARGGSSMIWTGREMIVWGGVDVSSGTGRVRNNGWRYDPQREVWSTVSTDGAPSPRTAHVAVWTGTDMIV